MNLNDMNRHRSIDLRRFEPTAAANGLIRRPFINVVARLGRVAAELGGGSGGGGAVPLPVRWRRRWRRRSSRKRRRRSFSAGVFDSCPASAAAQFKQRSNRLVFLFFFFLFFLTLWYFYYLNLICRICNYSNVLNCCKFFNDSIE